MPYVFTYQLFKALSESLIAGWFSFPLFSLFLPLPPFLFLFHLHFSMINSWMRKFISHFEFCLNEFIDLDALNLIQTLFAVKCKVVPCKPNFFPIFKYILIPNECNISPLHFLRKLIHLNYEWWYLCKNWYI